MSMLRQIARNRVLDILGFFSHPANGIHILNGHRTLYEKEPETFRSMLKVLSNRVVFIKIEDAVQKIMNHEHPNQPLVAFTFDDGFTECFDIFAPALEEYGINALFFINPNYAEGNEKYISHFNNSIVFTPNKHPMRWKQIRDLSDRGHIIGAHTMDHYMINTDDEKMLTYQICDCKSVIEHHIGKSCDYFAFPYGKLTHANQTSIDIACKHYKYVFSQSDYKHYFSFDDKVINRRHFEPFWPKRHVFYFLSCNKTY